MALLIRTCNECGQKLKEGQGGYYCNNDSAACSRAGLYTREWELKS